MNRWLLIAGDFTPLGGMDRANYALASSLAAAPGADVHLVAHRVWPDLERERAVHVHRVRRPFGSHLLGAPLLAAEGERRARAFTGGSVVANGGNADAGDVTWVHYLHAAHTPTSRGLRRRLQGRAAHSTTSRANAGRCGTRGSSCATARERRATCTSGSAFRRSAPASSTTAPIRIDFRS